MPKLKTNQGAAKRFRKTSTGYKHRRMGRNHLHISKSNRRKRALRSMSDVSAQDTPKVDKLLPYGPR